MPEKKEINAGVAECRTVPGSLLVDVRNESEYAGGHIPGSINFPMSKILKGAEERFPDKDQPIFVYCQSGARSSRAAKLLAIMGYTQVTDLGGICDYRGEME